MENEKRDEYYARIERITGNLLFEKTVGIFNAPFVSKAVELLASCGVLGFNYCNTSNANHFYARVWGMPEAAEFEDMLSCKLKEHNQFEDRWRFSYKSVIENQQVIIAGGIASQQRQAYLKGRKKNIPVVLGALFANGTSAVSVVWPGQVFPFAACADQIVEVDEYRYFDWVDLNNQMANIVKAILLEGTAWERGDIMSLLYSGKRTLLLAHPEWPWVSRYVDMTCEQEYQWFLNIVTAREKFSRQGGIAGKTILIVGLGSLGSIAADHFRILGCTVIGIDGKEISIHNPVRQLYGTARIGQSKAFALAQMLGVSSAVTMYDALGICPTIETSSRIEVQRKGRKFIGIRADVFDSREGSAFFQGVLDEFAPDLVILATSHQAEYRMADLCREKNIPHIIGRCYNRARWFEITNVDGQKGPCFGCLQGHLYKGVQPSLTEEQLARYDISADDENALQAEPATRVDTARCADSLSRFALQFLQEKNSRAAWFSRMLEEERTCMIGGNCAEYNAEMSDWSFGVLTPGGTALYGVINFIGSEQEEIKTCIYCGKSHEVLIKRRNPME